MSKNPNDLFYERLYRGYAGEHYVSALLYEQSYEVFRLPADFGLDLVVTNQLRTARQESEPGGYFPFALQVKSRWIKPESIKENRNTRQHAPITMQFDNPELELITNWRKEDGLGNAAYVFVIYWPITRQCNEYEPNI